MTKEEAIKEIKKVFVPAFANYIITALTEGATVSDIQHRRGRAYEAGVKDGLEQEPCEDAVSRAEVLNLVRFNAFHVKSQIKAIENMPSVTPQEPFINKPCVSEKVCEHDKNVVLDKIAKIIEPLRHLSIDEMSGIEWDVLRVIDKYREESEE
jgi:hypothetical protein